MKVTLRIRGDLYEHVLRDLRRPHAFAAERVGFLGGSLGRISKNELIVLFNNYYPVADDLYIDDWTVGARINSEAIRRAMQVVLDTGQSIYHVHLHDWRGFPSPGTTDRREIPPIVKSLHNVGLPHTPHGFIVLSKDRAAAFTSIDKPSDLLPAFRVAVVGRAIQFLEEDLS